MKRKSSFKPGEFIMQNPFISLLVVGGGVYGINLLIKGIKKNRQGIVEESEKNPFNYTTFIDNTEKEANRKGQTIATYTSEEAIKQAQKLHETWNTIGFDYPEEAVVIIRNTPSKYDFAKVLQAYNSKYGYDYQAKIKDKYNAENYDKVINTANDINTKYRIRK
jgi:hypothetical protein